MTILAQVYPGLAAELGPEERAEWHVAATLPWQERIALRNLANRGFGVYLPMAETEVIHRGERATAAHPMIPGYVFIFLWNADLHISRIHACPGVAHLLYAGRNPAIIDDELMNRIRAVEDKQRRPLTIQIEGIRLNRKNKRRRNSRRQRRIIQQIRLDPKDILEVHAYSPFMEEARRAGTMQLGDSRFGNLLKKALGLIPMDTPTYPQVSHT